MARRLFYLDQVRGDTASIHGETAKHMRKVLRVEPGMHVDLSDRTTMWTGEVTGFGKDQVDFRLLETLHPPAPPVVTHLLAAIIKFDHFEWILEKATELGVAAITPVIALRTDHGLDRAAEKRRQRWLRILDESGQQCRRLAPPRLNEPVPLEKAVALDASIRLWLEEESGAPPLLRALPAERRHDQSVALLVGPEGGWDPRERDAARAAAWTPVSLGPQILRAETAAISALAVVNAAWLTGSPDSE